MKGISGVQLPLRHVDCIRKNDFGGSQHRKKDIYFFKQKESNCSKLEQPWSKQGF